MNIDRICFSGWRISNTNNCKVCLLQSRNAQRDSLRCHRVSLFDSKGLVVRQRALILEVIYFGLVSMRLILRVVLLCTRHRRVISNSYSQLLLVLMLRNASLVDAEGNIELLRS